MSNQNQKTLVEKLDEIWAIIQCHCLANDIDVPERLSRDYKEVRKDLDKVG